MHEPILFKAFFYSFLQFVAITTVPEIYLVNDLPTRQYNLMYQSPHAW